MSTDYGYACLSHDPPLFSEAEINHGLDALADALARVRAGTWPERPDGFGGTDPQGILVRDHEYMGPIYFLRQHPRCRIGIVSEYGEWHLTDDGALRLVADRDDRLSLHPVRDASGRATGNHVRGVYPPDGMERCTCVTPVLAIPQSLTRPDHWVLCTTCGGTSLPGERG